MTLKEWCKSTKIIPTSPTTETRAVSICFTPGSPGWEQLWHLADYVVSSVCGGVVWLVPILDRRKHPVAAR